MNDCQKKVLDIVLAGHNIGAVSSLKSFLMKQISECTTKTVHVTSTTGRATKGLKNKAKTIHLFAGIGDCHGPNEVFCVFQVLSENLKRCKGVLLCFYAENGVEFLIVFVQLLQLGSFLHLLRFAVKLFRNLVMAWTRNI